MSLADLASHRAQGWDGHERRHGRDADYSGPERRTVHRSSVGGPFRGAQAWDGDDRRRAQPVTNVDLQLEYLAKLIGNVEDRQTEAAGRMDTMQRELSTNTEVTTEVRELLAAAKSGLKVIGAIGTVGMWVLKAVGALGAAAAAVYTIWHLIKNGKPPGV